MPSKVLLEHNFEPRKQTYLNISLFEVYRIFTYKDLSFFLAGYSKTLFVLRLTYTPGTLRDVWFDVDIFITH